MTRTVLACLLVLGVVGAAVPPSSTAHVSKPNASFTTHSADAGVASQALVSDADAPSQANATEFPPGVNESGITDPLALVDAHQRALGNTSYTVSTSATYRRPNGTLVAQEYTVVRVAPGGDSYSAVRTQTVANDTRWFGGERSHLAVWANETDAVVAEKPSGAETTYHWTSPSRVRLGPTSQWERLYATVGAGDAEVVGQVERDGTTLTKLVSTPSLWFSKNETADSATAKLPSEFTALVDSQGVVRSMQTLRRTIVEDRRVVVTRTIRVSEMGNTTVERPGWYQQAADNRTTSEGRR
ncbi:hypothetical protein [Halorussus salinus]|uniref:hypothetical protein n=1 Tax=Halorussus salinus TaxID=1364935 RepID=UPI0010921DD3|nr:hypothetical protein [Halorussus salinus]